MRALLPRYRSDHKLSVTALRRRVPAAQLQWIAFIAERQSAAGLRLLSRFTLPGVHARPLNQLVGGIGAIGVPMLASSDAVVAALSIATLTDRVTLREAELTAALRRKVAVIAGSPT